MAIGGYTVTPQDREFYRENGYWISPTLFDGEQIERLGRRTSGFGRWITTETVSRCGNGSRTEERRRSGKSTMRGGLTTRL